MGDVKANQSIRYIELFLTVSKLSSLLGCLLVYLLRYLLAISDAANVTTTSSGKRVTSLTGARSFDSQRTTLCRVVLAQR